MLVTEFDFELPKNLIAQHPSADRVASKMLTLDKNSNLVDDDFHNLAQYLSPGDVLVLNDTKVIPARLYGVKPTGGRLEIMIEKIINTKTCQAMIKSSKPLKTGLIFTLTDDIKFKIIAKYQGIYTLELLTPTLIDKVLQDHGHMPLPPYINRDDKPQDQQRYQTVYAKNSGAIAAPTAGLHFDQKLLKAIKAQGVVIDKITLHVGLGTFQPVRVNKIQAHKMHAERAKVSAKTCDAINTAHDNGNKVLAVGTTSLRALETAAVDGKLKPFSGMTDIFITPGFRFKVVDILLTNFHLPRSTLLMLVSAFAGLAEIKKAYQHAIDKKYRFYSYGDCMLLNKKTDEV